MLTQAGILKFAETTNQHVANIHRTVAERDKGEKERQAWRDACRALRNREIGCFYLWDLEVRHQMRKGEREVIEDALLFLEVDPWFFRSGYLKHRVITHLKAALLNETDKARLRNVIRAVAMRRNRPEFRDYCRLALKVWEETWEEQLRKDVTRCRPENEWKFKYLLRFMYEHRHQLPPVHGAKRVAKEST